MNNYVGFESIVKKKKTVTKEKQTKYSCLLCTQFCKQSMHGSPATNIDVIDLPIECGI